MKNNPALHQKSRLTIPSIPCLIPPEDAGLAELVDALDSKSSSKECGFESHSRYAQPTTPRVPLFASPRQLIEAGPASAFYLGVLSRRSFSEDGSFSVDGPASA